jgi:phosphatidylglycerol---prolipoprotein diacylglyceryl transferase
MASHGGIAGLIIAVWGFARSRRINPLLLLDPVAATGFFGVAFGRIANFVNGELWGRPTTVPWAVVFPQAPLVGGLQVPRHPSQLYAAVIEGVFVFAVRPMGVCEIEQARVDSVSGLHCLCYRSLYR